ncbi:MAG: dTDP-4-dehydrorhamnose 3,5-epimerase family protein [Cryomorphaceae bacterium]|nr:dTDP-4-dehydrorhamnose 3,5-epimerase family protein [Cryomorphaceae bacterium]
MSSKVKDFEIVESNIVKGVKLITPSVHTDERGTLFTTFYDDVYSALIPSNLNFKHDKFANTLKRVLRGIHGDTKSWKLVTTVFGEITQVVVDNRKDSPTYKNWQSFKINGLNPQLVLLPPGVGNAFYVHSDVAVYHYKLAYMGEYFDAEDQFTLKWNDPEIGIEWPDTNPVLSNRDK